MPCLVSVRAPVMRIPQRRPGGPFESEYDWFGIRYKRKQGTVDNYLGSLSQRKSGKAIKKLLSLPLLSSL